MTHRYVIGGKLRSKTLIADHRRMKERKSDFFTRLKPHREPIDERRHRIDPTPDPGSTNDHSTSLDPVSDFVIKVSETIK